MDAAADTDLRAATLGRQFPVAVDGADVEGVVALYDALGPVQTQVLRSAYLAVSARLPGTTFATVTDTFASYRIVKATTLRGTVHTSTPRHHALSATVADLRLAPGLRSQLRLRATSPAQVRAETARRASGGWVERSTLVDHVAAWLRDREDEGDGVVTTTSAQNLVSGHPALVRRPHDDRWHTRTDTLRRVAIEVCPDAAVAVPASDSDASRAALVAVHLRAYGPATRRDVAWWLGDTLRAVDAAIERLGDDVVQRAGPDGQTLLDVLDAPPPREPDAVGTRLLGEFDGLLLGYAPAGRARFADPAHVASLYAVKNGLLPPLVLDRGRLVGAWRSTVRRGALDLEVVPFAGARPPARRRLAAPFEATSAVLGLRPGSLQVA